MEDTMYDSQIREAMERFHQVWSRVSTQPASHIQSDPLSRLTATLCLLHRHYAALTACFPGHKTPQFMARETAQHHRRLLAEYYLREGSLPTPETPSLPQGKRALLRSVIQLEKTLSDLITDQRDLELCDIVLSASDARKAAAKELLVSCF